MRKITVIILALGLMAFSALMLIEADLDGRVCNPYPHRLVISQVSAETAPQHIVVKAPGLPEIEIPLIEIRGQRAHYYYTFNGALDYAYAYIDPFWAGDFYETYCQYTNVEIVDFSQREPNNLLTSLFVLGCLAIIGMIAAR